MGKENTSSLDELLSVIRSLSEDVENLKGQLTETRLRTENAELKAQLAEQKKHEPDKPLASGKNLTNAWLEEKVSYNVPFDHVTREEYVDVVVNGHFFRIKAGATVKLPRYVALVLDEKERNAMVAFRNSMKLQEEFRTAESSNFVVINK